MSEKVVVLLICLWHCSTLRSSGDLYHTTRNEDTTWISTFDAESLTTETTVGVNYDTFSSRETTRSYSSFTTTEAPLFFSIVSLTIRSARVDQVQSNAYAVDILLNSTCPLKRDFNVTLTFHSNIFNESKRCLSPLKHHGGMTCDHFIYGIRYTVDGFLSCGTRNLSLSPKRELYEIAKPKYVNSTTSSTSIGTLFLLPGLFDRLMIELSSVNQTCSLVYSPVSSPFYRCLFENLPPAQWFVLTYYTLTDNHQTPSTDVVIVHTDLEELHFRCELNRNNQQIDFHWTNLTASGYSDFMISVLVEEKKQLWTITCDPYKSHDLCSTKPYRLEPGRDYHIAAKLRKVLPNYNGQRTGTCSIKTNLSQIVVQSIKHEFLDELLVRFSWFEHPFHVQARLRNIETHAFIHPLDNNQKMAVFANLTEASVYQLDFNISKVNWSVLFQNTNYHIQTVTDDSLPICSSSNTFNQLLSGTIYNLSVSIHRDSLQNKFIWSKQIVFKLVNTNPSALRIHSWKSNEYCAAELLNSFPISYTSKCTSAEKTFNCNELPCGCRYQFEIFFNQTYIDSLCSICDCDIQLNHPNVTTMKFQTPLETVRNFRIVSVSPIMREIEVDFDYPPGCFDQVLLVCETNASKQRRISVNATVCKDLIPEAFYRIHVETKRIGWETTVSQTIESQLIAIPKSDEESRRKGSFVGSVLIPGMIAMVIVVIVIVLTTFAFTYRQRRHRKRPAKQDNLQITTISSQTTTTKLNNILNQVNIYPNGKRERQTDSKRSIFTSRPIRIKDLSFEYEQLIANNYYNVSDEFHKLRHSLHEPLELTQCDQLHKNRYKDIIPYEHSRVKLIPVDECDSGYINANFIAGLHNPREYIACQGPLKSTINDHWRMIWEQNVMIIVMLTEIIERGMNKCERYWPVKLNEIEIFGDISVSITNCVNNSSYDLRYMELQKNDELRSIKHYAFKMWDDHTVPTNSDILINFIRLIRSECRPDYQGPILVHCSAGVGRSGTFIALDRLLQQFDKVSFYGYLDIYGTVLDMRRCRDKMVQNEHQYLFIYRCLKEEYEKRSGNTNDAVIADDAV